MTLRLRFGVAGVVVVALLVALGLIIPRVVTTSQTTQVDQQLTEALPRALVLVKGSGTSGLPPAGKKRPRCPVPPSASATSTSRSSPRKGDRSSRRPHLAVQLRRCQVL